MSLYNSYDNFYSNHEKPAVTGGKNRAATALRDEHGRFMPVDEQAFEGWQLDPEHGRHGGITRAAAALRDEFGRFAKDETGEQS